jgi:hypothetical protein
MSAVNNVSFSVPNEVCPAPAPRRSSCSLTQVMKGVALVALGFFFEGAESRLLGPNVLPVDFDFTPLKKEFQVPLECYQTQADCYRFIGVNCEERFHECSEAARKIAELKKDLGKLPGKKIPPQCQQFVPPQCNMPFAYCHELLAYCIEKAKKIAVLKGDLDSKAATKLPEKETPPQCQQFVAPPCNMHYGYCYDFLAECIEKAK